MQCSDIDDTAMQKLCGVVFPKGNATPSTLNRHLYTPVLAILRMALREKAPMLARPRGHAEVKSIRLPPEDWYVQLAPHLNPSQKAFMMFLAMHGRRTREALARTPADLKGNCLDLGRTKNGKLRQVVLEPACLALIVAMPGWEQRRWLFGAGPNSANSFRRDLKAACKRAGVEWYHPHAFGRHMSVTRMLQQGYSVSYVADAHGMTHEMVHRRYGHLTKSETTAAMHQVGRDFYNRVLGEPPPIALLPAPEEEPPK